MVVSFQSAPRRRGGGGPLRIAISLAVAFGLTGLYVSQPPLRPPGRTPQGDSGWVKCPDCGTKARPKPSGACICPSCGKHFNAEDANNS
jgi:hypothetical protein